MKEKYDMEVTPERADFIKKKLIELWEHQHGVKVSKITVLEKKEHEPA